MKLCQLTSTHSLISNFFLLYYYYFIVEILGLHLCVADDDNDDDHHHHDNSNNNFDGDDVAKSKKKIRTQTISGIHKLIERVAMLTENWFQNNTKSTHVCMYA